MPLPVAHLILSMQLVVQAAEAVPLFDLGPTCSATSGTDGLALGSADRCRQQETDARDQLRREWATFPSADRSQCSSTASRGASSYVMLLTCLEMARDARRLPRQ